MHEFIGIICVAQVPDGFQCGIHEAVFRCLYGKVTPGQLVLWRRTKVVHWYFGSVRYSSETFWHILAALVNDK